MTVTLTRNPRGWAPLDVNWCDNPHAANDLTGWGFGWFGANAAGNNQRFASGGGMWGRQTFIMKQWTTASAAAAPEAGAYYTVPASAGLTPGKQFWVAGSMQMNMQRNAIIRVKFLNASNAVISTVDGVKTFPPYDLPFEMRMGPVTVPTGTTNVQIWFCLFGDDGGIPSGALLRVGGVGIFQDAGAASRPTFDGDSGFDGLYLTSWSGTVGNSYSIRNQPDPFSILSPWDVLGYDVSQASRNMVHQLIDGTVAATLLPSSTRQGTLRLFFTDAASAENARKQLAIAGTWALVDTAQTQEGMTFVLDGMLRKVQADNRLRWTVEVPYRELS
jgi:hypothetical protein